MSRDEIIRMAREAGVYTAHTELTLMAGLERFAALVVAHALVEPCCQQFDKCQKVCMPRAAAAEREACAKVCEEDAFVEQWKGLAEAAKRIRARGQDAS